MLCVGVCDVVMSLSGFPLIVQTVKRKCHDNDIRMMNFE